MSPRVMFVAFRRLAGRVIRFLFLDRDLSRRQAGRHRQLFPWGESIARHAEEFPDLTAALEIQALRTHRLIGAVGVLPGSSSVRGAAAVVRAAVTADRRPALRVLAVSHDALADLKDRQGTARPDELRVCFKGEWPADGDPAAWR